VYGLEYPFKTQVGHAMTLFGGGRPFLGRPCLTLEVRTPRLGAPHPVFAALQRLCEVRAFLCMASSGLFEALLHSSDSFGCGATGLSRSMLGSRNKVRRNGEGFVLRCFKFRLEDPHPMMQHGEGGPAFP
jgi:hypothetical protein